MRSHNILSQTGIAVLATLSMGCNNYEIFLVSGQEQASFSNDADVVFIVDNSSSMTNEAEALALNFGHFIDYLTDEDAGANRAEEDISDAVTNYITYVSDRGRLLDYQLAITTTSIAGSAQGAAGSLVTTNGVDIIRKRDENVERQFNKSLLCSTTCWDPHDPSNPMPNDADYECNSEDPTIPDAVSYEFLDCVCGSDVWQSGAACGQGTEEGLEAAFLAMCRAVDNPPSDCFHEIYSPLTDADIGSNAGMVRDDSTVIFLLVSDEGDQSRRLENQDADPTPYLDLLDQFNVRYRFAVIGPPLHCEIDANGNENCSLSCNSGGALDWGTKRYQVAAKETQGFFNPIAEEGSGGTCQATQFSDHLEDLGKLLNSLVTAFPLQSVPDIGTIEVFVDDEQVPPALEYECEGNASEDSENIADLLETDMLAAADNLCLGRFAGDLVHPVKYKCTGNAEKDAIEVDDLCEDRGKQTISYEGRWSYDSSENAVVFYGPDIPDYHEVVRIYYRPLEGMPRTLPFDF